MISFSLRDTPESGYVYHELLNADVTKAKGVGEDEFCLFLNSLGSWFASIKQDFRATPPDLIVCQVGV
ncbi:hypothetical protein VP01_26g8 [Puccinia sorghi]|uniref:Uncharacterized protein n=1 Tax=Puccinia sorghi TaxID=27349 RepID=A0A0L6V3M3_9BASI|nr:hypothetical protein VP01_26g8 [Puccinia sorghi]